MAEATFLLNGALRPLPEGVTAFSYGKPPEMVVVLGGYALAEDVELSPGDELFVIPKGETPPAAMLEQMMAARHTPGVHQSLKGARVGIAGLGGLGSHIAVSLARMGVGFLLLVDFDSVEPSNLNRQHYSLAHLGFPKTEALAEQLRQINPFIEVATQTVRVTPDQVRPLFDGVDVLCEAFDRPDQKAMLVSTALRELPEIRIVAASGMAGYGTANTIQTVQRGSRLYLCGDQQSEAAVGMGLMAPRVQVCAGHQANMVVRLLLGEVDA